MKIKAQSIHILLSFAACMFVCLAGTIHDAAGGDGKCQCGLCADRCSCCTLKCEKEEHDKECWEIECKQICIPKVVFPWQKNCCNPCANNGACVRTVRVLKSKTIKCPKLEYEWKPKMIGGCGCCSCTRGCQSGACCDGQPACASGGCCESACCCESGDCCDAAGDCSQNLMGSRMPATVPADSTPWPAATGQTGAMASSEGTLGEPRIAAHLTPRRAVASRDDLVRPVSASLTDLPTNTEAPSPSTDTTAAANQQQNEGKSRALVPTIVRALRRK